MRVAFEADRSIALLAQQADFFGPLYSVLWVIVGFTLIIFVHELGHFLAAKWVGIRVDRFAIGFIYRLVGYRRGQGITFGPKPIYSAEELAAKGYGETDYCLNALPIGGYVRMLGEADLDIDEKSGKITIADPRAFPNKSVGARSVVVCAGVVFNIIFAILAFAGVYLAVGKQITPAVIGAVEPGSPAERAGLKVGDRVVAVNGQHVESFMDLHGFALFTGETLVADVIRDGQKLPAPLPIDLKDAKPGLAGLGAGLPITTEVAVDMDPRISPLKKGDRIRSVDGRATANAFDLIAVMNDSGGRTMMADVDRPRPGQKGTFDRIEVPLRGRLALDPAIEEPANQAFNKSASVLGLVPRAGIDFIEPGSPSDKAGFKSGDVILVWGGVPNPTTSEIVERIILSPPGTPIQARVLRDGQEIALAVVPRLMRDLFGVSQPKVGASFMRPDQDHLVVANIVADTPAAQLNLPRGALIVAVDGQPVQNWFDLIRELKARVGQRVQIRYQTGGAEAVAEMTVPSSMVDALKLPPTAEILAINDQDTLTLPDKRKVSVGSANGLRAILEHYAGQTVRVKWRAGYDVEPRIDEFTVNSDKSNTDPWQMRLNVRLDRIQLTPLLERIETHGNVLTALRMGCESSFLLVERTYWLLKRTLTRSDVVRENVSGPVGIFSIAYQTAQAGIDQFFIFLAVLSVNLAILNFLPLPLLDGGQMVLLMLEKVRGKPLSPNVQMWVVLSGLILIGGSFLMFTAMDVSRLAC